MGFWNLFYRKENGQQKKWLIVPTVLLPIGFSIWGLSLSIQANNISVSAAKNREQIDTLISIVKSLQIQNTLLAKSVNLQENQLLAFKDEQAFLRRPKLSVIMDGGELSNDTSNIIVRIINTGGAIFGLRYRLSKGVRIDSSVLISNSQLSSGSSIRNLNIGGLKNGATIDFMFTDELGVRYSQQLRWRYDHNGEDINFGALTLLSKAANQ